jgi:hypothetical protein
MYQIIREKSLLRNRFIEGHEPILRDTLTVRVRFILNGLRAVGLWSSDGSLFCWDHLDQVAGTADGAHLPAKGA